MEFEAVLTTTKHSSKKKNSKKYLIIHHTGTPNYEGMKKYLSGGYKKGQRNVSVHYVVGQKKGQIAKIGEHDQVLWHVGMGKLADGKIKNLNSDCIGIEICSDGNNYTNEQKENVRELINYIIAEEGIPIENILRHYHVSSYRGKWDVGTVFFEEYGTWEKYQKSFSNIAMTEEKIVNDTVIPSISALWNLLDNIPNKKDWNIARVKRLLHSANSILRKKYKK
ncbi:MAG: N-acetylmuramoyl-L-alanine amidase [archaeon]|nr:N-acetylmuramoyl-L-alanine amidase [archaeon]